MNYLQRLGLLLFLIGAFARMEWFIKNSDNINILMIFYVVMIIGLLIFMFSNSNQEKMNKE